MLNIVPIDVCVLLVGQAKLLVVILAGRRCIKQEERYVFPKVKLIFVQNPARRNGATRFLLDPSMLIGKLAGSRTEVFWTELKFRKCACFVTQKIVDYWQFII